MLDEYKQLYIENADLVPGWRDLSKSELANLYIENEGTPLANSYFSALMCKYWNLIGSYYHKQRVKIATETDCYDWLIEGITKALDKRVWKDPNNALYTDKIGAEKAMTVCISSTRLTFYQYTQHDKRSLNYTLLSLDALEENYSDGFFIPYEDEYENLQSYLKEIIIKYFNVKDYFVCFMVDALFNADILVDKTGKLDYNININKFCKYIENMDEKRLADFAKENDLDKQAVLNAFSYIQNMPHYRLHYNINRVSNLLKHNDILKSLLRD